MYLSFTFEFGKGQKPMSTPAYDALSAKVDQIIAEIANLKANAGTPDSDLDALTSKLDGALSPLPDQSAQ